MKKTSTALLETITANLCRHLPPIDAAKSAQEVAALIVNLAKEIVEQIEQIKEQAS